MKISDGTFLPCDINNEHTTEKYRTRIKLPVYFESLFCACMKISILQIKVRCSLHLAKHGSNSFHLQLIAV